jgi:SAM-dependent methyltransferase
MQSNSDCFLDVTEIQGQMVSPEQVARSCHRYHWAAQACQGKDVLEVGCGAGQGLTILARVAKSLVAGDYSPEVLAVARANFPTVPLSVFEAEHLPFNDASFDVVLLFEALYYVDAAVFFAEAKRVLRPGGALLLVTANKDLYDFTPSPFARRYLGAGEIDAELREAGFEPHLFAHLDTSEISIRQRILRPLKAIASRFGVMPKTMRGKEALKKLFFGSLVEMPGDLAEVHCDYAPPHPIEPAPDRRHKVIYCRADMRQEG